MMAAAPGVTLDAHRARYSLAARRGGSHPTDEGMRTFPQMAAGEDIIADRLGGQNRWPLTEKKCELSRGSDSVLPQAVSDYVLSFCHEGEWN